MENGTRKQALGRGAEEHDEVSDVGEGEAVGSPLQVPLFLPDPLVLTLLQAAARSLVQFWQFLGQAVCREGWESITVVSDLLLRGILWKDVAPCVSPSVPTAPLLELS